MSVDGRMSLEMDGLTEEKAIEEVRALNKRRKNSLSDLFSVITEYGLGTGPREIDFAFAQAQYLNHLRHKQK